MPKSTTRTPSGSSSAGQPPGDLDAEGVVAQEDVADAGDEDAWPAHGSSGKPTRSKESFSSSLQPDRPAQGGHRLDPVVGHPQRVLAAESKRVVVDDELRRRPACGRVTPWSDSWPSMEDPVSASGERLGPDRPTAWNRDLGIGGRLEHLAPHPALDLPAVGRGSTWSSSSSESALTTSSRAEDRGVAIEAHVRR